MKTWNLASSDAPISRNNCLQPISSLLVIVQAFLYHFSTKTKIFSIVSIKKSVNYCVSCIIVFTIDCKIVLCLQFQDEIV